MTLTQPSFKLLISPSSLAISDEDGILRAFKISNKKGRPGPSMRTCNANYISSVGSSWSTQKALTPSAAQFIPTFLTLTETINPKTSRNQLKIPQKTMQYTSKISPPSE